MSRTRCTLIALTILASMTLVACGAYPAALQSPSSTAAPAIPPTATNTSPSQSPSATTPPAPPPQTAKTIVRPMQSEPIVIRSLKERIATSTVIVLGELTGQGEAFNAARDTSDRTKPATNLFGVGQVYHVRAIRYLKGTGPEILNVFQAEGMIDGDPATVTQDDIARAKAVYGYLPFEIGQQYVLFLNPFRGVDVDDTYYGGSAGAASPWRFALAKNGELVAEGPGIGELMQPGWEYAPRPLATFTAQVEQLVQAEKDSTPTK